VKLLLVEDKVGIADFLDRGLSAEGWTVSVVPSGCAALRLLRTQRFHVVMVDLGLAGLDAVRFVQDVRKCDGKTSVVALSSFDVGDERVSTLDALGVVSLRKPFGFDALLAQLKTALESEAAE